MCGRRVRFFKFVGMDKIPVTPEQASVDDILLDFLEQRDGDIVIPSSAISEIELIAKRDNATEPEKLENDAKTIDAWARELRNRGRTLRGANFQETNRLDAALRDLRWITQREEPIVVG